MKFHVRLIQFDILLVLNKYTFKIDQFLVKYMQNRIFAMAKRIHYSIIILWQFRIYNFLIKVDYSKNKN